MAIHWINASILLRTRARPQDRTRPLPDDKSSSSTMNRVDMNSQASGTSNTCKKKIGWKAFMFPRTCPPETPSRRYIHSAIPCFARFSKKKSRERTPPPHTTRSTHTSLRGSPSPCAVIHIVQSAEKNPPKDAENPHVQGSIPHTQYPHTRYIPNPDPAGGLFPSQPFHQKKKKRNA